MINAVGPKIRQVPAPLLDRVVGRLKTVKPIDSFPIGRDRLGPAIRTLCEAQGLPVQAIHLDEVAKLRLLGMSPSFKQRAEAGEKIEDILSSLELAPFLTQDQNLYILGYKGNITKLSSPDLVILPLEEARRQLPAIAEFDQLIASIYEETVKFKKFRRKIEGVRIFFTSLGSGRGGVNLKADGQVDRTNIEVEGRIKTTFLQKGVAALLFEGVRVDLGGLEQQTFGQIMVTCLFQFAAYGMKPAVEKKTLRFLLESGSREGEILRAEFSLISRRTDEANILLSFEKEQ